MLEALSHLILTSTTFLAPTSGLPQSVQYHTYNANRARATQQQGQQQQDQLGGSLYGEENYDDADDDVYDVEDRRYEYPGAAGRGGQRGWNQGRPGRGGA